MVSDVVQQVVTPSTWSISSSVAVYDTAPGTGDQEMLIEELVQPTTFLTFKGAHGAVGRRVHTERDVLSYSFLCENTGPGITPFYLATDNEQDTLLRYLIHSVYIAYVQITNSLHSLPA